jgi:hypothetical protein
MVKMAKNDQKMVIFTPKMVIISKIFLKNAQKLSVTFVASLLAMFGPNFSFLLPISPIPWLFFVFLVILGFFEGVLGGAIHGF